MLTYTTPQPPLDMSLKARMAYAFLFNDSDYSCIKTNDGCWIIVTKDNLNDAEILPDDATFINWLEAACDFHMSDDGSAALFLSGLLAPCDVKIDDMFGPEVIGAIRKHVSGEEG